MSSRQPSSSSCELLDAGPVAFTRASAANRPPLGSNPTAAVANAASAALLPRLHNLKRNLL
jgi:hypothetical protein